MAQKKSKQLSIVDQQMVIDGILSAKGRLVVRGTVKGHLEGEEVVIAREGAVYADVRAAHVTVDGTFDGNLWVSGELKVLARGKCLGKVTCSHLVVEAGGVLNADVTYGSKRGTGTVVDAEKRLLDQVVNLGALSPPGADTA